MQLFSRGKPIGCNVSNCEESLFVIWDTTARCVLWSRRCGPLVVLAELLSARCAGRKRRIRMRGIVYICIYAIYSLITSKRNRAYFINSVPTLVLFSWRLTDEPRIERISLFSFQFFMWAIKGSFRDRQYS